MKYEKSFVLFLNCQTGIKRKMMKGTPNQKFMRKRGGKCKTRAQYKNKKAAVATKGRAHRTVVASKKTSKKKKKKSGKNSKK